MKYKWDKTKTKRIAAVAVLSALGYILMMLEFPLPAVIPDFIKFDFSELPALLGAYIAGPFAGVMICLIKNILKALTMTMTGGIGEICNFFLGACLVLPVGLIYKKRPTTGGAVLGAAVGAVTMALMSLPINYFIIYPIYSRFMPVEQIIAAYSAILPFINNLFTALVVFNLPFTFLKAAVSSVLAIALARRKAIASFLKKE